jgi:hypothetical protein
VVEASSHPDQTPPRPGRRTGRPSVLTPPLGLPVFPPRRRPAQEPADTPPVDAQLSVPPSDAERNEKRCSCGHPRAAHEHYRRGSDCGICGAAECAAYARASRRRSS